MSDLEDTLDWHMKAAGIPEWQTEFKFHPRRKWRADRAWPNHRLLVEVEGGIFNNGRHVRPIGFRDDCIKYNEAAILGYRVIRVTADMIESGEALDVIMRALGTS